MIRTWSLVAAIVLSTVVCDLLQAHAMRRGGKRWKLPLAIVFMAVSFFAFTQLLTFADVSFAVPATAASIAIETLCARIFLHERVTRRRWAGALLVTLGVALLAK
jgi:drug/metabolite transporter (DMT)-like permease